MQFRTIAAAALAAAPALAAPLACRDGCLTVDDANQLVQVYAELIGDYSQATADKYLTDDFKEFSDSINAMAGTPLGAQTFDKASFEATQSSLPPTPLTIEDIAAVQCSTIAVEWHAKPFGAKNLPVKGKTIISASKASGDWQISQLDVEFNSLVWYLNLGGDYSGAANTAPSSSVTSDGSEQ